MICTFLRAIQYTEKLHRSSAKRLLLPHIVLNKACLKTEPSLRWGLQYQKKTVRPRCILGVTQKTIWTQGPSPQKAKEGSSKQVSVHRSQREGTAVPTSQKGKKEYFNGWSFNRRDKSCQCSFTPSSLLKVKNQFTWIFKSRLNVI